ncbi:MAG: hypothetical protein E7430_00790 [Ruminococcaceae bacterium]|nr:hypothetical protein [Oscillospiraceae bacterium]
MNRKISAEFDSAYMADRAYGRIKALGIAAAGIKYSHRESEPEPGLFITQPYPRQQYSYYNNLSFGLPETTGTSIRMDTTILGKLGDSGGKRDSVRIEVTVNEHDLKNARSILINSGARSIRCIN